MGSLGQRASKLLAVKVEGLKKKSGNQPTAIGFKPSGPFKFFFDIINFRLTFLDAKGPIK